MRMRQWGNDEGDVGDSSNAPVSPSHQVRRGGSRPGKCLVWAACGQMAWTWWARVFDFEAMEVCDER